MPSAVTATAGTRAVTVSWSASTDNVGVANYTVQRSTKSATSSFTQVASVTATTWTNSGLSNGKRYWYRVRATDAAGNASGWSSVVTAVAG